MPDGGNGHGMYSIEAEEAVLGAILLDSKHALEIVRQRLRPTDFWVPQHQILYTAMLELGATQQLIDVVPLQDVLTKHNQLARAGGLELIADIAGKVPTAENVDYYARIVQNKSLTRQVHRTLAEVKASGTEGVELYQEIQEQLRLIPLPKESRAELCMETTDLLSVEPQPPDWLIAGLAMTDSCVVIGGEPKAGKTWFALVMAICFALGVKVLGRWQPRRQGKVLIFSPEGGPLVASNRLHQLVWGMGINPVDLRGRLLGLSGRLHVDMPQDYQRLLATIEVEQPDVLLLDPLIGIHHADENSASEMQPILDSIRDLRLVRPGLSVWLVHHTSKNSEPRSRGYSLRGSGALTGWYDTLISLRWPNEEDSVRRVDIQHRCSASPEPGGFTIQVGTGLVAGLESVRLTGCDAPSMEHAGKHSGGRTLDMETVVRVKKLVTESNDTLTRSEGAAKLGLDRHRFNRYFKHLEEMGVVALGENKHMVLV
jgi:RecA-family ATPase